MFAILSAGIAPAFALMSFFYLKDKYAEPLFLTFRIFLLGAVIVLPIMFIQYTLQSEFYESVILESFFIISLSEEFFKWFIFIYVIYHHTEFDAHYDGIVYAVAISLGFATVENVLYLFANGIQYAFLRAVFPVSSHALFGVLMGYYFGKAKIYHRNRKKNIFYAFLFPFILHGTYNYILKTADSKWLMFLLPFMILLWVLCMQRMKNAAANTVS